MRRHLVPRPRRRWLAAIAAAVVLAPVAGCSKTPEPAGAPVAAQPPVQPFSIFLGDSLGVVDYAQLKVLSQCLADAGYPQNLRVMADGPYNPFKFLIVTDSTFGPASEQLAKQRGFGQDRPATPPPVVSFDPNYDRTQEKCSKDAWKKFSPDAEQTYQNYFQLGNELGRPFLTTVTARVGEPRWRTLLDCLSGKGYRTTQEKEFFRLPDPGVFGVPLAADIAEEEGNRWQPKGVPGTIEVGPAQPATTYRPTPRESEFAVAWFECRRDTGIAEDQMDVVRTVQAELVAKNEDRLTELNPRIEKLAKQAAELIGRR